MIPPRIKEVIVHDNYMLEIIYINGEKKLYDMKKNLDLNCYSNLKDINYFKKAKSAETTIEWPNGEDIDPNELYENSILYK
ncbi:MAG: DUF2442 domain-containing protein [Clostridia bacterium]|nr:DUF2442 domain-containing protein [Clostridia bacterium]